MRGALLIALTSLLAGCNPDAALWVRIEAPFVVPDEANGLHLIVERPSGAIAFEKTWALDENLQFPQTLSLVDAEGAPEDGVVQLRARALRDDALAAEWAESRTSALLKAGELQEVVLRICDCPENP